MKESGQTSIDADPLISLSEEMFKKLNMLPLKELGIGKTNLVHECIIKMNIVLLLLYI